jgi:hypothetical protein
MVKIPDDNGDDGDDKENEVSYLFDFRWFWAVSWRDGARSVIAAVCGMILVHLSR